MKIFLIGFMGSGKTTMGRKLAARLSYFFADLDHVFESHTGKTVPQYFSDHGEDAFRQMEKQVLQAIEFPDNSVIATGGGAPCFFDNMEWMNANGITVYLSLPPSALAARLESAGEVRPVLQNRKGAELVEFIKNKLEEREPYYKKARLIVNGLNLSPEKLAAEIDLYQRR